MVFTERKLWRITLVLSLTLLFVLIAAAGLGLGSQVRAASPIYVRTDGSGEMDSKEVIDRELSDLGHQVLS